MTPASARTPNLSARTCARAPQPKWPRGRSAASARELRISDQQSTGLRGAKARFPASLFSRSTSSRAVLPSREEATGEHAVASAMRLS